MQGRSGLGAAGPFVHLGLQLGITIALFTLLGHWLDGRYGTGPWVTVGGAAFGMTAGLYNFIRAAIRQEQQEQRSDDERGRDGGGG